MAGAGPGTGGGKLLGAAGRATAAGAGAVPVTIRPVIVNPKWLNGAANPPRVISLPPSSSSNASSSVQSFAPGDDGPQLHHQPSSSLQSRSLQEWGQGDSPVEQEVVVDDDFCASDRLVFGPSPTREEVLRALTTIQRIFVPVTVQKVYDDGPSIRVGKDVVDDTSSNCSSVKISASKSLPATTDPELPLSDTRMGHSKGVIDALRSLPVNPSIKKMVVSISSDKAVWDAVMRNDAVKEVKRSFFADQSAKAKPGDTPDLVGWAVSWILDCTKTMLLTLLDKIWTIAKEVLQMNHGPDVGKKVQAFEEIVRSSFMISVVVFIVVVLFRVYRD